MSRSPLRLFLALALSLLVLPAAHAQIDASTPYLRIDKMGNFEIQDLMVSIDYAETRRGQTQATVTVRQLDKSSTTMMALVATATNGRTARIALRAAEDGTLTGTGTLPTLGNTSELALMVSRDAGFRFGIPVYDERNGWNIEQGSAWKVEEGETLTGSAEGNGWRIDISMDWPLDVDITIEG